MGTIFLCLGVGLVGLIVGYLTRIWITNEFFPGVADSLPPPSPKKVEVCSVTVNTPDRSYKFLEVVDCRTDETDCEIRTRKGEWCILRGWTRVSATPWIEYVPANLEELANVLVGGTSGEEFVPPDAVQLGEEELVDVLLDRQKYVPPPFEIEDPLAKNLFQGLDDDADHAAEDLLIAAGKISTTRKDPK